MKLKWYKVVYSADPTLQTCQHCLSAPKCSSTASSTHSLRWSLGKLLTSTARLFRAS